MANQEQLDIIKKGVDKFNKWREDNPTIEIDLSEAHLRGVYLGGANLRGANLTYANLGFADFRGADFRGADLRGADLSLADLREADLSETNLSLANLREADLRRANLSYANLREADLSETNLSGANLVRADLSEANLRQASSLHTAFANTDLSNTIGLESINHGGASTLGTDTLKLSKGKIPEIFLRGCGLSDWEIEATKLYNPEIDNDERNKIIYKIFDLQASQAIQISNLFISYSHADSEYVDKLEKFLNEKGIRFWRDIHDATAGKLEKQINRAIRLNSTVLLVLSENSIKSDWVQHEVRLARKLEQETEQDVLCPVALDASWKKSSWPERIMEQVMEYNILDFSKWKDDSEFEKSFMKLIKGLDLFYKKEDD